MDVDSLSEHLIRTAQEQLVMEDMRAEEGREAAAERDGNDNGRDGVLGFDAMAETQEEWTERVRARARQLAVAQERRTRLEQTKLRFEEKQKQ